MKYNKIIIAAAALLTGMSSCTDEWDSHYKTAVMGEGASLWESISNDPQLSNFAKVLQATGYDKSLASSQMYTVFAPNNSGLTDEDVQRIINEYNADYAKGLTGDKNAAIKEFVQNHIALYNYSVAPETPATSIRMMNGKYVSFTTSSFSGNDYIEKNRLAGNGVLYTMDKKADYAFNLYEYIKKDPELDSLSQFLYHYHYEEFKPEQSVAGEIIDGKQHYLDSVTVSTNEILTDWINARIDSEDSTYYCLMPTNKAWAEQIERNKELFRYDKQVANRDSFEYVFPRVNIIAGAQFSKTTNPKLGESQTIDSIMSPLAWEYQYRKQIWGTSKPLYQWNNPYASGGIMTNTNDVPLSNGVAMKTDEWKIDRSTTFLKDIIMEAEGRRTLDSLSGATKEQKPSWISHSVKSDNPYYNKVSDNLFYTLQSNTATMPGALFDFQNVLSNQKYDMYVVTVPAAAGDTLTTDVLPTCFQATVYWHDLDGNEQKLLLTEKSCAESEVQLMDGDIALDEDNSGRRNKIYDFRVDPSKVCEIKLGTFIFPTCSYSLDNPQVKVYLEVCVSNSNVGKTYSKNLHIDMLKLIPHVDD